MNGYKIPNNFKKRVWNGPDLVPMYILWDLSQTLFFKGWCFNSVFLHSKAFGDFSLKEISLFI